VVRGRYAFRGCHIPAGGGTGLSQAAFIPVVLAGGSGERFWPLSRRAKPKQFLALDNTGRSLIQATADRLEDLAGGLDNLLIVGGHAHRGLILEHLPDLPIENLVVEPVGRNTAPAVLLAALRVEKRYGAEAIMGVFPSDHHISESDAFKELVKAGLEAVERFGGIVTLGITPSFPSTGYGYIECAEVAGRFGGHDVRKVSRFVEKPDEQRAKLFVESGQYLWNAGMFLFTCGTILEEFRQHAPELYEGLVPYAQASRKDLAEAFEKLEKVSIDYAILERSENVFVIPADFGWDDLGDWNALERLLKTHNPNVSVGQHLGLDTTGAILYTTTGQDLIVTIGLDDVVIVRDGDVTLVARKDRTQDIKKIVERLKSSPDFERYA
jgi:mannose-1-phosphate guanylyltransferase